MSDNFLCTDFDLSNLTVKLVDFGNGEFGENLIQEEIGLRSYRCPENIMNEHYDTKSDIWVVGCIAYELITGEYLLERGIKSGRKMGQAISEIKNKWVENNFNLDDKQLAKTIKKFK